MRDADLELLMRFGVGSESEREFGREVDPTSLAKALRPEKTEGHLQVPQTTVDDLMTDDHLSRSDIVRLAGIDNDVLTFWLRQGLIRPIHAAAGRGRHLRFDMCQLKIAGVLSSARLAALNVDALRAIAAELQNAVSTFQRFGLEVEALVALIEEIENQGTAAESTVQMRKLYERFPSEELATAIRKREAGGFITCVENAAKQSIDGDLERLWLFLQLWDCDGYLLVYRNESHGEWVVERTSGLDGNRLPARSCILIDLNRPVAAVAQSGSL